MSLPGLPVKVKELLKYNSVKAEGMQLGGLSTGTLGAGRVGLDPEHEAAFP